MAASILPRFILLTLVAGSLAVGCNPKDKDGDGFKTGVGNGTDCDDDDPDIYPNAPELCDGVDNNCDGTIDEATAEDAVAWYGDGDGDGYGDDVSVDYACDQPNGYVDEGGDCDDADVTINPETVWYADADADGYGDPEAGVQQCAAPDGYVANDGDCDDTRADVNPGEDEQCDEIDHDCNGSDGRVDLDGDGVAACEGDCDDDPSDDPESGPFAADIYPDAVELCDAADNDCDDFIDEDDAADAPTWYLDYDADSYGGQTYLLVQCDSPGIGWVDNNTDCYDLRADTYPGADELCDDWDNDCDGVADESPAVDAPIYYIDSDGDGYGTESSVVTEQCDLPAGYAEELGDCDDSDFDTHPGASEYCDGEDDNCDGIVDEATAVDVHTWYIDNDGDDFGNAATVSRACNEPAGYTAASGDCNDTDSTINPDADEYCDGTDNDCDGVTDEGSAVDADTWYADDDGDDYGDPTTAQNACSQPPGFVADDSDCDDGSADINPGADEICNDGIDNDCDASSDSCTMDVATVDAVFVGAAASDEAGRYITTIGDINADGIDDLLVPSRLAEGGAGATYLYYGSSALQTLGQVTLGDGNEDATIIGSDTSYKSGFTGTGGGDVDGDGVPDFAIGSATPETNRGAIWVYFDAPVGDVYTGEADVIITGDTTYDYLGAVGGLAVGGDLDDNGTEDLLYGAFADDTGATNGGAVFVDYGPLVSGTVATTASVGDLVYGTVASNAFGRLATGLGDIDGDGLDSFAVSTYLDNGNRGAVWLFHTPVVGSIADTAADVKITGESSSDLFGISVAPLGADFDGDGYDDLIAGATLDDLGGTDTGAVYVIPGNATSDAVDALYLAKLYGTVTSGQFGASVDGHGDYYGDHSNTQAILVGASYQGASMEGAVYLFLDVGTGTIPTSDAVAVLTGTDPSDALGGWVAFSGDLDGSGAPAIMASSWSADLGGAGAGAAYILFGVGE